MQNAPRDILHDLGYTFLGSRLKRLAERLQGGAGAIIEGAGLPLQPAQMPLLAALDRYGTLTVGEAAEALGVSQPAVTRTMKSLAELGFLETKRKNSDQRERALQLTSKGEAVMERIKRRVWPSVGDAATSLCRGLTGDLLDQIREIEARLDHRPFQERAAGVPKVRILDYRDELAPAFRDINVEWISSMFSMERSDRDILDHPRASILETGGAILFAETPDGGIVGTCALLQRRPHVYELTKMGVLAAARGLKVGEKLLAAAIARARELGAKDLYLLTNARCEAAIHLYEKAGFLHDEEVMREHGARYKRCDVAMRFPLGKARGRRQLAAR